MDPEATQENPSRDPSESMESAEPHEPSPYDAWRAEQAQLIVYKYVLFSIGAGAVPVPIFDVAASIVLQLKLIQELSDLYGFDHREDMARNAIGTLLTTTIGLMLGSRIGSSMAKLVPGVGTKVGIIKTAVFFAVSTHISGKILIMHFEAGGTLLNLDPIAMREHFRKEFTGSERYVHGIHKEWRQSTPVTA